MMQLSIAEIARFAGGDLLAADDASLRHVAQGLTWDSRKVTQDCVFVAMPGEHADGNDYIVQAIQAGAACVVCTRAPSSSLTAIAGEFACPLICVADGTEAIQMIASAWRERLRCVVIGVTGSVGKTSTKDFLRSIMAQRFKTHATQGNYNNEVGAPATILQAPLDTEVLVCEMGMDGLGQIATLAAVAKPSIGVVTNIGVSHMERLGSQDNIARAKSELLTALPDSGLAVLNVDDPYTPFLVSESQLAARATRMRTYGLAPDANVRAEDVVMDDAGHAEFTLVLSETESVRVKLPIAGRHNVSNALAAATVGQYMGLSADEIAHGLESAEASAMRMEVSVSASGVTVINDAYNASPDSMKSSLETLANMKCTGRRIAVLGDMGELGEDERKLHEQVGAAAASAQLGLLVCVGQLATHIAAGAQLSGMDSSQIRTFPEPISALKYLKDVLEEGDVLLVKASRFMGLERIVKGVVE